MTAKPCVAGALLVALVGLALRVVFAPVRWAESLTVQPAEEDTLAYVWWRDDEDRDPHPFNPPYLHGWQSDEPRFRWLPVGVDPDVEVAHNGKY